MSTDLLQPALVPTAKTVFKETLNGTKYAVTSNTSLLFGIHLLNSNSAVAYLQLFDASLSSVTIGTTTPSISIGIKASDSRDIVFDKPIRFDAAISAAATTTATGNTGGDLDIIFLVAEAS